MLRHFPLLVLLTVVSPFVTLHTVLLPCWNTPAAVERVTTNNEPVAAELDIPDFASIQPLHERKSQFFDFIAQYVEQRNQEILLLRKQIVGQAFAEEDLIHLAKNYRVKWTTPQEVHEKLVKKVDAVPPSLVLAQAALESAWGTSRFAAKGNNFFGQWCHTPGCGMVPNRRYQGLSHEVQIFESPFDSVAAYMRNLNSHPAYKGFRDKRAELRTRRESLNGCFVAQGLTRYSEMGDAYVESVKLLIRANQLERDPKGYCAPVEIAQKPSKKPPQPETIARDEAHPESGPPPPVAPKI